VFLPVMKMQYPEIVDVAMPADGNFSQFDDCGDSEIVSGARAKDHERDLSLGQAMFTKSDRGSGPTTWTFTISAKWCGRHCALWTRSAMLQFVFGPTDTLDHAARMQDYGSKWGLMRRARWASEGFTRPWPDEIHGQLDEG